MGPEKAWSELVKLSNEHNLLAKELFVCLSAPTGGLGEVMDNAGPHLEYQAKLERAGVMFAAGPLAAADGNDWRGDGLFVYRADSIEKAINYAKGDPMHLAGARSFEVRRWLLNEGTLDAS